MKIILAIALLILIAKANPFEDTQVEEQEEMLEPEDDRKSVKCEANAYDNKQYCRCPPGERISRFKSRHNNHHEDRIWDLECQGIPAYGPNGEIKFNGNAKVHESAYSHYDQVHWWSPPRNSFMVGMESHHNSHREDRQYRFFYQNSENWVTSKCKWHGLNDYDDDVDYVLQADQVIAALYSRHNNHHEDRKFYIYICTLTPKCTEVESIKYRYEEATKSVTDVVAGKTTKNNLNHPESASITTTISKSNKESLAQSYSYEKTKGQEIGVSLGLSFTYGQKWGPDELVGSKAEATITAGFSSTWSTSETWSRSNKKEITEENGFQVSFEDICPANRYCVSTIKMEVGEAQIPYTLKAYSKDNSEKCEEEGILFVKNSWGAESDVDCCKSKHFPCPQGSKCVDPDPGQCQDSIQYASNCPSWTWYCSNGNFGTFMQANCMKTCGFCQSIPGPVENCQWTGWRDRDDQSATCDCEDILSSEVTLYDKCMGNVEKYKIQLVSGGPVYTDYTAVPTNKISFDSNTGWIKCLNSLQSNCPVNSNNNYAVDVYNPQYNCCKDYKVNYCCAP